MEEFYQQHPSVETQNLKKDSILEYFYGSGGGGGGMEYVNKIPFKILQTINTVLSY